MMSSVPESRGMDKFDMNLQLHCIETEAYRAVLRAFIAQSNVLSWDKEGLITELRKELNVTDVEHRELLVKIDSDESVRMIRDWQKGTSYVQKSVSSEMNTTGSVPSSVGKSPHKKLKTHAAASKSWKVALHAQTSSAAMSPPFPAQCRDDQWSGKLVMFPMGIAGQCMKTVSHNIQEPSVSKGGWPVTSQSKKGFHTPDVAYFNDRSDMIEIRATDKLIHKVEKVIYGRECPDPVHVEKAKSILKEQERAILEGLAKLADVSDGDHSLDQVQHHISKRSFQEFGQ
ncbi:hypothetical protein L1049_009424 [Liquidambar formosana]|uniref:ENT domain-containing protein n=1 Tax=Liquidambar formosana TaxID=63359 RepID=A0AAP0X544_LIQFO